MDNQGSNFLNTQISRPVRVIILIVLLALAVVIGYSLGKTTPQIATKTTATKTVTPAVVPAPVATTTTTPAATTPPNPTAGWQTYTNSSLKFTFKYPQDWFTSTFDTAISTGYYQLHVTKQKMAHADDPIASINTIVYSTGYYLPETPKVALDANTDLDHFIRIENGLTGATIKSESKTIGGKQATRYVSGGYNSPWYIKSGSTIFSFNDPFQGTSDQTTSDQIFSTITFTN